MSLRDEVTLDLLLAYCDERQEKLSGLDDRVSRARSEELRTIALVISKLRQLTPSPSSG